MTAGSLQRKAASACPAACVVGHDPPGVPQRWEGPVDLDEVEWRLPPLDDGGLNVIEVYLGVGLGPVRQKEPLPHPGRESFVALRQKSELAGRFGRTGFLGTPRSLREFRSSAAKDRRTVEEPVRPVAK